MALPMSRVHVVGETWVELCCWAVKSGKITPNVYGTGTGKYSTHDAIHPIGFCREMFSFVRLFDNVRCLYPSLMA